MKKEVLINICIFSIFTLFVYTAVNKLIGFDFYLHDLRRSPELGRYALLLAILIPTSELIVAGLLLINKTRKLGFIGSIILMTAFTVYVAYVLRFTTERPCTCGGIIRSLSWPDHFKFNILFLALSVIGYFLNKSQTKNIYARM